MDTTLSLFASALALGFAVAAPLGPTGAAAVRHGLASGARATFWIGIGAAVCDLAYVVATYLGVTPLLLRLPWLAPMLYCVGAVMLMRMSLGPLRDALRGTPAPDTTAAAIPLNARAAFWLGITITIVNPTTITAWLTMGGAFVSAHLIGLPIGLSLGVLLGILVGSAAWWSILAALVAIFHASVARLPWLFRAIGALSGLVLLGFGLTFAYRGLLAVWQFAVSQM